MTTTPPEKSEEERSWARHQRNLTMATTGLTAAGAAAMGGMLAGKTKVGRKVLPAAIHSRLTSARADDVRNSIAMASMLGGVASGASWYKRLNQDSMTADQRAEYEHRKATNMAMAMRPQIQGEIDKAYAMPTSVSTAYRTGRQGSRVLRRATLRRPRVRY